MSKRTTPFVPLPCPVIDAILPTLKDTELRVLLVVLRQTWGWRGPEGKPKERDWLSHRQLKERTGRASEAVSAAVDALVRRGLVCVENEQGAELVTAAERRRVQARLYYRPGPLLVPLAARSLKTRTAKAKTTTQALASLSCPPRFSELASSAVVKDSEVEPVLRVEQKAARIRSAKQAIKARLAQIEK